VDIEGKPVTVSNDDGIRAGTTVEKLAQLKPVFRPNGKVTAGNACPLNDGAAATIVMSDTRAEQLGITPLARVVASGVTAIDPEIMGLGPIEASRQALGRAGMSIDQIDLVEINEAFAAQVIPSAKHLGVHWEKLNVNGGSIALGHPFGMTGARIMTTLLNGLEDRDLLRSRVDRRPRLPRPRHQTVDRVHPANCRRDGRTTLSDCDYEAFTGAR
jgi:acetyl-CoA C-acetyltransferase